ncbi:MAG: hypothetical protein MJK18_13860, partial [Bdellovibrionales bacterium]|nr:hypothetical protein [Bdellovibrionales bacterium]
MALVNVKRIYIYSLYSLLLLGLANCGAFQGVASFSLDPNSQNLSSDSSLVSDDINGNDINNTNGSFNIGDQGFVEVPTFQENDPSQQQADQQNYVQRQEELMRQHTQQRNQELAELSALNNRSEAEERLNFVQMREHLRIREIEGIGIEYMNITHHTSHRYNFVGPDASSCERAVKNGLNIDVKCSVGGGCGHDCGLPGSNCPSANPDLHGVCVEMVGPVILRYTPPSLARLGEQNNFYFNIDLPSRGATPVASCTMEYAPVCGTNGRTYGNSCVAREAN